MSKNRSGNILFIDTSANDIAKIALITDTFFLHTFAAENLSERLLQEIKKVLKKNKISFGDLEKIAVVTGGGGFSKVRTGVGVANALAFALKISILGLEPKQLPRNLLDLHKKQAQKMIQPVYERMPNITMPKK